MKLFIFSTQPEIANIIHDHFVSKGNLCITFTNLEDFLISIERTSFPPDLMILDYLIFNHDIFNIYNYLEKKNCNFPCIFYNDPCLTHFKRADHWLAQIDLIQNRNNKLDLEKLKPTLSDLEALIENEAIRSSIYLMQKPIPLPPEFILQRLTLEYIEQSINDGVEDFCKRTNLSKSLKYLLKVLEENQDLKLSLEDIKQLYENDNKEISIESLYVMISKLRGKIKADENKSFIISKDGKRYHFIKFLKKK